MPSSEVMHKWGAGKLHSGSKHGPKVKSQKQAVAIMMSEKRKEKAHGGKYPDPKKKKKKIKAVNPKHDTLLRKMMG